MIPCPSCGAALRRAAARCDGCGGPRLRQLAAGTEGARCHVHADRASSATCSRCGAFCCAVCLADHGEEVALCRSCHRAIAPDAVPWPWEPNERGWLASYLDTVAGLVTRPNRTLRAAPREGGTRAAVAFAFAAYGSSLATTLALAFIAGGTPDAKHVARWLAVAFAAFCAWCFVLPVADWLTLSAMRGEATLGVQVRAACWALTPFAVPLPVIACVLFPLWTVALKLVAVRTLNRASWGEALLVTLAVPALVVAVALFLRLDAYVLAL